MSEEQKVANVNAEAQQDVQSTLAELKAESQAPAEGEDKEEEARIVEAATKLGEKSEKSEENKAETRNGPNKGRKGRDNIKFDPSTQKETDDPVEIRKQVEFYFSDSNLPTDKFLLSKVGGSANNAVPLELLHTFKRMRRFQPFSAIVEALKSSETLDLTENDMCIRRKTPLPESVTSQHDPSVAKVFEDKAMSRSVYAKGFGKEEPSTQFDIEAFFAPYGPTNAIRLRRAADKSFKGSVFVEFESEEKQKAFLDLDPKPQWKGQDLLIKSKKQYCDEKVAEIGAGRVKSNRGRGGHRGRGGRGRGGGGGGDRRDWRQRRAEDQNKASQGSEEAASGGQKRSRDDEANGDHPAKKVDAKEE